MRVPPDSSGRAFQVGGVKLVGIQARPGGDREARRPAVLMLHGFPGAEKNTDLQRELMARGVASFALHARGAWGSEGTYRFSRLVRDAAAALRWLKEQPFADPRRVGLFGFSMGGWTALNLAAEKPALKAVCAVCPVGGPELLHPVETPKFLKRMSPVLRVGSQRALYADCVRAMKARDPAKAAAARRMPLLLVHGDADRVIPFSGTERIFASAAGPKEFVRAEGAEHDFLDRRPWLVRTVADWMVPKL